MSGIIGNARRSVGSFRDALSTLTGSALQVDGGVCSLEATISSLRSSTDTQEDKLDALEKISDDTDGFVNDVVSIDEAAAEAINTGKNRFYDDYGYLKPDSEKSEWEKFKEACGTFGDWVKDHWKQIVIGIVVIAVGAVLTALTGGTFLAAFLVGLKAALISGLIGGAISAGISLIGALIKGESFGTTMGHLVRSFGDGFAGGFMWGGIFAGASQILGSGLRIAAAKAPETMGKLLTRNGKISEFILKRMAPAGTKNGFKPSVDIPDGYKYDIEISKIFGKSSKFQIKWHAPDANALAKFPGSNAGTQWTAQLKFGNKLFDYARGILVKKPDNTTHIPLIPWRWF